MPFFEPEDPGKHGYDLAKMATIFAVGVGVCFGLCTLSVASGAEAGGYFAMFFAAIETLCIIGLLVVAAIAIYRSIRNQFRR